MEVGGESEGEREGWMGRCWWRRKSLRGWSVGERCGDGGGGGQ